MKLEYNAKILPDGHLPLPDKIKERLHLKSDDTVKIIVVKEYAGKPSEKFLATFGSWDDKGTPGKIKQLAAMHRKVRAKTAVSHISWSKVVINERADRNIGS